MFFDSWLLDVQVVLHGICGCVRMYWYGNSWEHPANTGACEHNHKYHAKQPGRRAAKNQKIFTKSVAKNIVDSHVLGVYSSVLEKHIESMKDEQIPETVDVTMDTPIEDDAVQESVRGSANCVIRVVNNLVMSQWKTKMEKKPSISKGLLLFITDHFGLMNDPTKTVTLYTQYYRNNTLFRCHPSFNSGLPWYDWVMMLYTSNRRPGVTLSCPARLMAIVCDNSDSENIYCLLYTSPSPRD